MNEGEKALSSTNGVQTSKMSVNVGNRGAKKPRKLTRRQSVALEHYATHGNKTAAAAAAGYADPNAAATRVFSSLAMKPNVEEMLYRHGITLAKILEPIKLALEANICLPAPAAKGKAPKLVETNVPDIKTRLNGHDRAAKLLRLTEGGPDRDKWYWEHGLKNGVQSLVRLILSIEPYLSPEGIERLNECAMGARDDKLLEDLWQEPPRFAEETEQEIPKTSERV